MSMPATDWRMNVAAIVMDDAGNILLGARPERSPYLHFPQGGVRGGESTQEALFRELREEMGIGSAVLLAEYPGLRYSYGKKNEKRARWQGQQQCFYLLRVQGVAPTVSCDGSSEFSSALWLPLTDLPPERFSPSKRTVAQRALTHFFPNFPASSSQEQILSRCTPEHLYLFSPSSPDSPVQGTPLFGGKRKEALLHLSSLPLLRPGKKQRLLIVLLGMEGCGLRKALRSVAATLDPITTRIIPSPERYAISPAAALPLPGEISLLAEGPYTAAMRSPSASSFASLLELENSFIAAGNSLIKIALHISPEKQRERLLKKGKTFSPQQYASEQASLFSLLAATSTPSPWLFVPADHSWYRDFIIHSLISHAVSDFFLVRSHINACTQSKLHV